MTLPAGNKGTRGNCSWRVPHRHGFTLIELILVMAMLLIVLALAAPSLGRFFRGRSLDSEARRFLALTRYGQSRAVSEGIPMNLWIDQKQGTYGLEADANYDDREDRPMKYVLDPELQMEVASLGAAALARLRTSGFNQIDARRTVIRFTPDGFIGDVSPEWVEIRQGDAALWVAQSFNGLHYEIQTNRPPVLRR